jgi:hypothetical protein
MFGKEKFDVIFKRLDSLDGELKQIRNTVENEIKIIEKAGKPVCNEITESLKGEFYNNPLRDIIQEVNSYFDTVISKANLGELIVKTLKKYDLDKNSLRDYISYLEKSDLIRGMMECGDGGFYPIYQIVKDRTVPEKKKSDRGVFDELGL